MKFVIVEIDIVLTGANCYHVLKINFLFEKSFSEKYLILE